MINHYIIVTVKTLICSIFLNSIFYCFQPLIYAYNSETIKALPNCITELYFGEKFNNSLYNALPPNVNIIKFRDSFGGSPYNYDYMHSSHDDNDTSIYQILKNINKIIRVHIFCYPKTSVLDTYDELIDKTSFLEEWKKNIKVHEYL